MLRIILVTASCMLLSGCFSMFDTTVFTKVKEADEKMVANCRFLGTAMGDSTNPNPGMAADSTNDFFARKNAYTQALRMGATHVVLMDNNATFKTITYRYRAYQCPVEAASR